MSTCRSRLSRPLLPLIALPLLLAACTGSDDGSGASASEARQLNEAAAMLDDDSVSSNMLDAPANQANEAPQ